MSPLKIRICPQTTNEFKDREKIETKIDLGEVGESHMEIDIQNDSSVCVKNIGGKAPVRVLMRMHPDGYLSVTVAGDSFSFRFIDGEPVFHHRGIIMDRGE